jgi:hypothetical protein
VLRVIFDEVLGIINCACRVLLLNSVYKTQLIGRGHNMGFFSKNFNIA